jgi:hypothetical protein
VFFPKYNLMYGRSVNPPCLFILRCIIANLLCGYVHLNKTLMPRIQICSLDFFTKFGWSHPTDTYLSAKTILMKLHVFHCPITAQVYERFDVSSVGESDDARFDHFCKRVSRFVLVLHLDNALWNLAHSAHFQNYHSSLQFHMCNTVC